MAKNKSSGGGGNKGHDPEKKVVTKKVVDSVLPAKAKSAPAKSMPKQGSSNKNNNKSNNNKSSGGKTSSSINPAVAASSHPGHVGGAGHKASGAGNGKAGGKIQDFLFGKKGDTKVTTNLTKHQKHLLKQSGKESNKYFKEKDAAFKLQGDPHVDTTAEEEKGRQMALGAASGPQQQIADATTAAQTSLAGGSAIDPSKATSTGKFLLQDVLDPNSNVTSKALTDPRVTGKGQLAPAPTAPGQYVPGKTSLSSGQLPGDSAKSGPGGTGAQSTGDFLTHGALDLNSNPYLQQSINAATRPISENLLYSVLPNVRSGAAGAGQYGSSRQGIAEALAANKAFQEMGDVSANVANQGYQAGLGAATTTYGNQLNTSLGARGQDVNAGVTGRGQTLDYMTGARTQDVNARGQDIGAATDVYKTGVTAAGNAYGAGLDATTKAIGLAPTAQSAAVQPAVTTSGVGEVTRADDQASIDAENYKRIYNSNVPLTRAQAGTGLAAGTPGGSTTTTNTGTTGFLPAVAGGAATGAAVGSKIPGLGPAVGAAGGAGIGGLIATFGG